MRVLRRTFGMLLLMFLLCSLSLPAAAANKGYTYTVRFYAGKQGTIGGGEVVVHADLQYGDRVTFNQKAVSLNDGSKYYIKGIRESGRDNNTVGMTSFIVTGDKDYVVAYGLLNDAVAYTVNYVDSSGRALAGSETYYGNVGDKPVIAYLYIEGYQPQAYNLTKTLTANAAENVFTFVYTYTGTALPPGIQDGPETGTDPEISETRTGAQTQTSQETQANTGTQALPGDQTVQGAEGDGALEGNGAGNEIGDQETPLAEPEELIDIDDDGEVPLSTFGDEDSKRNIIADAIMLFRCSAAARIIGMAVLVAITGVFLWFMIARGKEKKHE